MAPLTEELDVELLWETALEAADLARIYFDATG